MMNEIKINLIQLIKLDLNINEYLTLYKIRYVMEDMLFPFITSQNWIDNLVTKGFVLSLDGQLSLTKKANKLFSDDGEVTVDDFEKLYDLYPCQTPSGRVLHSKSKKIGDNYTRDFLNISAKYIKTIKNLEEHQLVMDATRLCIADHKRRAASEYMQKLETYVNQSGWERYIGLSAIEVAAGANVEKF